MNRRACFIMMLASCVAAGCQSMKVQTRYDHQVSFAVLRTFCWVAAPATLHNDVRLHMDVVEPLVQGAVEAQLKARGFQKNDCASADLQVTFTGGLEESYSVSPTPGSSTFAVYQYTPETGGEWFTSASNMKVSEHRLPCLVIQVRQSTSGNVIWEGLAAANLPAPADNAERRERIQKAVRLIMQEFPVPAGK
jgi:hypothetical protein